MQKDLTVKEIAMSLNKKELETLSKKELVDTLYNILTNYSEQYTKLPWARCPVCNHELKG
jgi:hypothetical protein